MKSYIEPDISCHEIKVGNYIVDIMRDGEIIEIQSRHFYKLKNKLSKLLETNRVTVVYPVVRQKWILRIDSESGEIMSRRKSPKTGRICHILTELYGIRDLLDNNDLSFAVVRLDAEECRSKERDSGECSPTSWLDTTTFGGTRERGLGRVLQSDSRFEALEGSFTAAEFSRVSGIPARHVHKAIKVLSESGVIRCVGKEGRRFLWQKVTTGTK
jgi:hypothetical protein